MNATSAINAYAHVELETSVATADPHKLIVLLYQGALLAISNAKNQMLRKEIAAKGKSISHAIMIIEEGLKASLDKNAGGELAQNLSDLYEYMSHRLLVANLKNDTKILDEVRHLLSDLKSAWEEIRPQVTSGQSASSATAAPARAESLTYGKV